MRADEWMVRIYRPCDKCGGGGSIENKVFSAIMDKAAEQMKINKKPPSDDWWKNELAIYGIETEKDFPPEMIECPKCKGTGKIDQLIRIDEFIAHFIRGGKQ